jgi:hypothetical protein
MTTHLSFDEHTLSRIDRIRDRIGANSNVEVIRQAVALLETASRSKGSTLIIKTPTGSREVHIT